MISRGEVQTPQDQTRRKILKFIVAGLMDSIPLRLGKFSLSIIILCDIVEKVLIQFHFVDIIQGKDYRNQEKPELQAYCQQE